jgi:hypothetical protein
MGPHFIICILKEVFLGHLCKVQILLWWFQCNAFLHSCRHLKNSTWPDHQFSGTMLWQSLPLAFDRFSTSCELLWPIFHLVVRRCRIPPHNQYPFTNNFYSFFPLSWGHFMSGCLLKSHKIHANIWIGWFALQVCHKFKMDWVGIAHTTSIDMWEKATASFTLYYVPL